MHERILRLNIAGSPVEWLNWEDAVTLQARGMVAWTLGSPCMTVRGGRSRQTGEQSRLVLHSIMACEGADRPRRMRWSIRNGRHWHKQRCRFERWPGGRNPIQGGRQGTLRATSWRIEVTHCGEEAAGAHAPAFAPTPLSVVGPEAAKPPSRRRRQEGVVDMAERGDLF